MNNNVEKILAGIYSETKENELSKVVDAKVTNGVMSSALREYYVNAVRASEQMQENATWANAYLVSAIVSSENFTKAFKDRTDLAETIGYSKSTISKLLAVVELKDVLFEKGYTGLYTVGQLSELVPSYNEAKKKELSIIPMLDYMEFDASMTSKQVREGIKSYKNSLVHEIEQKPANGAPTTSSVSAYEQKPANDTPTTSSVSAYEQKPELNTPPTDNKLNDAIQHTADDTKSIDITFKSKSNKKTVLKVDSDKFYELYKVLIDIGLITVEN